MLESDLYVSKCRKVLYFFENEKMIVVINYIAMSKLICNLFICFNSLTIKNSNDRIHSMLCIEEDKKMHNFDPKEHIGLMIKFLNGKISNKINKNLAEFNLTGVQHEIICFIDRNESQRDVFQKDIERCLKLTNPTVTGIVKRLEEKEMIARVPSEQDARYKCLHVTEKGKEVICKSFKFGANNIEKQLAKGMTDKEVKVLKDLLYKALKNMEE